MAALQLQRTTQRTSNFWKWLNAKSVVFSRMIEEPITRLQVILVNLLFITFAIIAVCIEQAPVISIIAIVVAGYLIYQLKDKPHKA